MKSYTTVSVARLGRDDMSKAHLPSPISYREDINGLRAWAVIGVLLFHFSLIGLPGGFAGVDIFFVISGYLMTSIIVNGYEKGGFSIVKFYLSRLRRILPALLFLLITLLLVGWFFLPDYYYLDLIEQAKYSLGFISNFYYFRSAGYFDNNAHEKWLLHTWSLAVEAQFYILFPAFIAVFMHFFKAIHYLFFALVGVFILSFVLNVYVSYVAADAAFYLLPTRGWELLAGAIVFLLARSVPTKKLQKSFIYVVGWLLIFLSFILINDKIRWPGYWALLPVFGASFIIFAQVDNKWLTNNFVAQWIGDRSYSLYLWHWPLIVFLYFFGWSDSYLFVFLAFIFSFVMADISYNLIEVPTRRVHLIRGLKFEVFFITLIVSLLVILMSYLSNTKSINTRFDEKTNHSADQTLNRNQDVINCRYDRINNYSPGCILGEGDIGAVLIGDSHSEAVAGSLIAALKPDMKSLYYLGGAFGCPVLNSFPNHRQCESYLDLVIEKIKNIDPSIPVFIVNKDWSRAYEDKTYYSDVYIQTMCLISRSRSRVYVSRPIPGYQVNIPLRTSMDYVKKRFFGSDLSVIGKSMDEYNVIHQITIDAQNLAERKCGVKIIDLTKSICFKGKCSTTYEGMPIYYDHNHLNELGGSVIKPSFVEAIDSE